jgi:hypothetical protein
LSFDVYYLRSDLMPIKATLVENELVVIFSSEVEIDGGSYADLKEQWELDKPLAIAKITNFERVAFVDITKENIKTNDVNLNEDSNTNGDT